MRFHSLERARRRMASLYNMHLLFYLLEGLDKHIYEKLYRNSSFIQQCN